MEKAQFLGINDAGKSQAQDFNSKSSQIRPRVWYMWKGYEQALGKQ